MRRVFARAVAALLLCACAESVKLSPRNDPIYDAVTSKLRIQIDGYTGDGSNIKLKFIPPLAESAYTVVSTGDNAMSVLLKAGKKWPLSDGLTEVSLFVTGVTLGDDATNVLEASVVVATVVATPSVVRREDKLIYMTGSSKVMINGTSFRSKSTSFSFDPPLFEGVDYVLSVKSETATQLTLVKGRSWRSDGTPGPLKLTRVDTGAGALRVDYKMGGVTVAEVQADLGAHGVTVETTSDKKLYQSTPELSLLGNGFNTTSHPDLGYGNILRWANSLQGRGANYTITKADPNQLTLALTSGSKWRANAANLPAQLILLAVNAGAGPIPVGATTAKKGRAIATIYEDPAISAYDDREIYRSYSHELWVQGAGFTQGSTTLTLESTWHDKDDKHQKRQLRPFVDYYAFVYNTTHLQLKLLGDKDWADAAGGELRCVGLDTGAGVFEQAASSENPVVLGKIVEDTMHKSGAVVTRTATTQVLYATPSLKKLVVSGENLCGSDYHEQYDPKSIEITFYPYVEKAVYKIHEASQNDLQIELRAGQHWPVSTLYVTAITCSGNKKSTFNGGVGVGVATILEDPFIEPSTVILYRQHSKRLVVHGQGLNLDTRLTLDPTPYSAYSVIDSTQDSITLELAEGASWAPESSLKDVNGQQSVLLKLVKADTAAGEIQFGDNGVVVATVVAEPEGDFCDDSCEFSKDGVCDDGTQPYIMDDFDYWDDDYGGYDDDDFDALYYDGLDDGGYDDSNRDNYDYYDDDRDFLPACAAGTDCTDCQPKGGDAQNEEHPEAECENTCQYARDGMCDDTRMSGFCAIGTDCQDCGPVSASNYTVFDDEFWDDDAANWYRNDDAAYYYYGEEQYNYGAYDDDWQREWSDDEYWEDDDLWLSDNATLNKLLKRDDDDGAVGYVRSVPGPFEVYDDMALTQGNGEETSPSMLLAGALVVALPILGCFFLRMRRGGRASLLPFLAKGDKKNAAELAESWSEMSERKNRMTAQIPITPDVTFSGSRQE